MMNARVLDDFLSRENLFKGQFILNFVIENPKATNGSTLITNKELNSAHVILREVQTTNVALLKSDYILLH